MPPSLPAITNRKRHTRGRNYLSPRVVTGTRHDDKADISTLQKRGHFYFGFTARKVGKLTRLSMMLPSSFGTMGLIATDSGGIATIGCPLTKRSGLSA